MASDTQHATSDMRRTERPLEGLRVVITRAEDRADGMVERLRALGAEPLLYPTIAFVPPEDCEPLDAALRCLSEGGYDWLVLTSVTAVRVVAERLEIGGWRLKPTTNLQSPISNLQSPISNLQLAAVGSATAAACAELLGMTPAVVPEKFVAEALAEALGSSSASPATGLRGQRVLLANADIARPTLEERLRAAGAAVDRVVTYHTVPAHGGAVDIPALLAAGAIDAITFTSGSTVRYFAMGLDPGTLAAAHNTIVACIGPVTAQAAQEVGLPPAVVAATSTEEGLVDALVEYVKGKME